MWKLAKIARALQTVCPVIVMALGMWLIESTRADAERYPGPPYYLPFAFFTLLVSGLLGLSALSLWIWKLFGWVLNLFVDGTFALLTAYAALSDMLSRPTSSVPYEFTLLGVSAWFGLLMVLLLSRPSRQFFPGLSFVSEAHVDHLLVK